MPIPECLFSNLDQLLGVSDLDGYRLCQRRRADQPILGAGSSTAGAAAAGSCEVPRDDSIRCASRLDRSVSAIAQHTAMMMKQARIAAVTTATIRVDPAAASAADPALAAVSVVAFTGTLCADGGSSVRFAGGVPE